MLTNYLKTAWRNLTARPAFSALNVAGLALGLAVCLLILLLPLRQWRTDRFHENADRVYRVLTDLGANILFATSPGPLARWVRQSATGVETVVQMRGTSANLARDGETFALQREGGIGGKGLYAEPSFFEVFDGFEVAGANAQEALRRPYSVVLTREAARKLFDEKDPVGQTVRLADTGTFTVTGVLGVPEGRSHLDFDALFSFSTLRSEARASLTDWSNERSYHTYLLLEEETDPQAVEAQLHDAAMRMQNPDNPDFDSQEDITENPFMLEGMLDLPFNPTRANESGRPMLPPIVLLMLGGVALLVVFAAGVNYANLSVARSLTRAREVGVRRTVGATRRQVAGQFLSEAVIVALLALGGALALLQLFLPAFNNLYVVQLGELGISHSILRSGPVLGVFVAFSVAVGLCAGAYPALMLSRFRPTEVLRGGGSGGGAGKGSSRLRKALTGGQFALSLIFMVTGALIYQQAQHMIEGDYGFTTENVVTVDLDDVSFETFRNEARAVAGVKKVLGSSLTPANLSTRSGPARPVGEDRPVDIAQYAVSPTFLEEMGLSFAGGRAPSEAQFGGGRGVVMNAAAARALQLGDAAEARGRSVVIDSTTYRVAGIVEGFQFNGLGTADEPVLLRSGQPSDFDDALVRVAPGAGERVAEALAALGPPLGNEKALAARPYADLLYARQAVGYDDGARFVGAAALLAVVISCLGLLGMAAYAVEARRKEVAVRMAMGASAWDIGLLLSKGFLALVGVAVAVGLPVAWLLNRLWLEQLASRVAIQPLTLAGCAAGLALLALAAVGSQAWRATRINPAQALRDE